MSDLRLSMIREDEIGLLHNLIKELAEYEKLGDAVTGTLEELRTSLFEQRAARALFAREDNEIVGYAVWCYNFSTFECKRGLYLEDIYIRPAFRRRGYGKMILRYLARLAMQEGCARMEWVVLNWNQPAINFYRRTGAVMLEEWRINRLDGDKLSAMGETEDSRI